MKINSTQYLAFFFFILHWFYIQDLKAQYSKGYFQNPIQSSPNCGLSGTMGELRNNHFHGGLDIRTNNQTGWPVYASAEGYVYRINISPSGYGKALYIKHPNGYTTVYGHLDGFIPELEAYILKKQYELESYAVDLYPDSLLFAIKKGDKVAISGNTGSSGGPHLHFEIRDSTDAQLNPLLFGLDKCTDKHSPYFRKAAVVPMSADALVEGGIYRREFTFEKTDTHFSTQYIKCRGWVGVEFLVNDQTDEGGFKNGINFMLVKANHKNIYTFDLKRVPLEETRTINAFMNYYASKEDAERFHCGYLQDGNTLDFCSSDINKGKIYVAEGDTVLVDVRIADSFGNTSDAKIFLVGSHHGIQDWNDDLDGSNPLYRENYWLCKDVLPDTSKKYMQVYLGWKRVSVPPIRMRGEDAFFAWDLRSGLADSIRMPSGIVQKLGFEYLIPSKVGFTYYDSHFDLFIPSTALYDTLYFKSEASESFLQLGSPVHPLKKEVYVYWKCGEQEEKERTHVYRRSGRSFRYLGGDHTSEGIRFKTRDWGEFVLLKDSIPPVIRIIKAKRNQISCQIWDELSGFEVYGARLNDEFLLLSHDSKSKYYDAVPKSKGQVFKGSLIIYAVDRAGNRVEERRIIQ